MGSRNISIDTLKSLAILLVVFGHCIQYGAGADNFLSDTYYGDTVFKIIYSFHMPLFMLISGYLFAGSIRRDERQLAKKFRSLVIPVFCWTVIEFCYFRLRHMTHFDLWDILNQYFQMFLHHFWFLWAVFWCCVIVILVRKYLKDSIWAYIAILLLTFFVSDSYNLSLYKYVYPYFIIGYFFSGVSQDNKMLQFAKTWKGIGLCFAVYVLLLLFYSEVCFIYTSGYTIIREGVISLRQAGIDLYRFAIGLTGSVFLILTINKLSQNVSERGQRIFECIGKNTLGIYILSYFLFFGLRKYTESVDGIHYWLTTLETAIITAISLLTIFVIKKSRIARKLLLGVLK